MFISPSSLAGSFWFANVQTNSLVLLSKKRVESTRVEDKILCRRSFNGFT